MAQSRQFPVDLLGVAGATLVSMAVLVVPELVPLFFRVPAGFLLVLFAPGYAVLATLFPSTGFQQEMPATRHNPVIYDIERVVLAVPISVAVSVVTGFALTLTPFGIQYGPLAVIIGSITLAGLIIGMYRRRVAVASAGTSGGGSMPSRAGGGPSNSDATFDSVLWVGLVVVIVLAVGIVAYPLIVPTQGESYTSVGLYTEGANGTLVSTNYPTNLSVGESTPLVLSVDNETPAPTEYTVVVLLQNISEGTNRIQNETRLHTFSKRVDVGEEWEIRHEVTATMSGDRLRLQYLLYENTPPATPSVESADYEVHLWIHVMNETSQGDSSLTRDYWT